MACLRRWAGCSGSWFIGWARYSGAYFLGGMLLCWVALNLMAGPGVVVLDQVEAEGPSFSDPATLDVVSTVRRNRVCPSQTQRWVWRWTTYKGQRAQQAVPLMGTEMPFLADDGVFILTLPSSAVPDPQGGGWYFRSVTAEHCTFLPSAVAGLFGSRVFRSKDLPVNFVGDPHAARAP